MYAMGLGFPKGPLDQLSCRVTISAYLQGGPPWEENIVRLEALKGYEKE
jgi:hypothetical protein